MFSSFLSAPSSDAMGGRPVIWTSWRSPQSRRDGRQAGDLDKLAIAAEPVLPANQIVPKFAGLPRPPSLRSVVPETGSPTADFALPRSWRTVSCRPLP